MTLVIGTWTGDAVVLATDSKVWVKVVDAQGTVLSSTESTGRKLFNLQRTGIATYGDGPTNRSVPDIIDAHVPQHCTPEEARSLLLQLFADAPNMGALVGGLNAAGNCCLYDVPMRNASPFPIFSDFGKSPPIVLRGPVPPPPNVDQATSSLADIVHQMDQILNDSINSVIGPPFTSRVIHRDAAST